MSAICKLFVKTVKIDNDQANCLSTNNEVQNFGIKIRSAKPEELDRVAELLLEGYRDRLSSIFEEGKRESFINIIKSCYESNPDLIHNVLVAIEDDKIQGICSLKFANDELKKNKKTDESLNLLSCKALMRTMFSFGMNDYLSKVTDGEAFVESLGVDPESKMETEIKGLLLQAASDECQERNCSKISSIVMFKNFESRRFYENFGYTTSKLHMAKSCFMYGDKGCYKMEKQLNLNK